MEYAGAVETSLASLGHELQHMYFAKGVMPANGNAGWIDEAIASWRDNGHQSLEKPDFDSFNLGNHGHYIRTTHKKSYVLGRSFIGHLDYKLKELGQEGMKNFLRIYKDRRIFTTITNSDFIEDLNLYSGYNFGPLFDKYIFGKTDKNSLHHPTLDEKELNELIE